MGDSKRQVETNAAIATAAAHLLQLIEAKAAQTKTKTAELRTLLVASRVGKALKKLITTK